MTSTANSWPIFNLHSFLLQLLQYYAFNFLQVPAHGRLGGSRVAPLQSGKNSAVTGERFVLPSFHLQRPLPRLARQIHQPVHYLHYRAVVGRQSDVVMKLGVLVDSEFAPAHLRLLAYQNLFHLSDLIARGVQSGAPGQGRLDHIAHVQQFRNHLPLLQERGSQGIVWRSIGTANHRADTLAWLKQALQFQAPDGIAHRAAADPKHLHKLTLWGQQIAGFQLFRDVPLQLLGDLLVDLISGNRLEPEFRW